MYSIIQKRNRFVNGYDKFFVLLLAQSVHVRLAVAIHNDKNSMNRILTRHNKL